MPEVVRNPLQLDVRIAASHFGRLVELLAFLRAGQEIQDKYRPVFASCSEMLNDAIWCHAKSLNSVSRSGTVEIRRWFRADKIFGIARYKDDKSAGAAELERLKYICDHIDIDESQQKDTLEWAIDLASDISEHARAVWHSEMQPHGQI